MRLRAKVALERIRHIIMMMIIMAMAKMIIIIIVFIEHLICVSKYAKCFKYIM